MDIEYFYSLTPSQFRNISQGKQSYMEWQAQTSWEQTRWLATIGLQPHLRKGRKVRPEDLVVFPWEKKVEKIKKQDPMVAFMAMINNSKK